MKPCVSKRQFFVEHSAEPEKKHPVNAGFQRMKSKLAAARGNLPFSSRATGAKTTGLGDFKSVYGI